MSAQTTRSPLPGFDGIHIHRLDSRPEADLVRLPMTIKILLEGLIRHAAAGRVDEASIAALARWPAPASRTVSI